jgi:hypothetical protein
MARPLFGYAPPVVTLCMMMCLFVPACGQNSTSPPSTATRSTMPPPPTPDPHLYIRGTGIWGRATAGPTCPVERIDHPCPPRPIRPTIQVLNADGRIAATTRTDAHGWYTVRLAPGEYVLHVATTSILPRCPDTPVSVGTPPPSRADIHCDTGIR